jgi:hypothetical protein
MLLPPPPTIFEKEILIIGCSDWAKFALMLPPPPPPQTIFEKEILIIGCSDWAKFALITQQNSLTPPFKEI